MAINSGSKKEKVTYNVKVLKAAQYDWGITCDIEVNGVTIYGCVHREGVKADGTEWSLLSMPSRKATDGKYYNHVFFPMSKDMLSDIEKQIENLL